MKITRKLRVGRGNKRVFLLMKDIILLLFVSIPSFTNKKQKKQRNEMKRKRMLRDYNLSISSQ